jgi:hypothetical protein
MQEATRPAAPVVPTLGRGAAGVRQVGSFVSGMVVLAVVLLAATAWFGH